MQDTIAADHILLQQSLLMSTPVQIAWHLSNA